MRAPAGPPTPAFPAGPPTPACGGGTFPNETFVVLTSATPWGEDDEGSPLSGGTIERHSPPLGGRSACLPLEGEVAPSRRDGDGGGVTPSSRRPTTRHRQLLREASQQRGDPQRRAA